MNGNNKIQIDISLIPEYIKEDLAATTLGFIQYIRRKYPEELKAYVDVLSENTK